MLGDVIEFPRILLLGDADDHSQTNGAEV